MDTKEIIKRCEAFIREGKDSYFIDQELNKFNLISQERQKVVEALQVFELTHIAEKNAISNTNSKIVAGIALLLFGILITVFTISLGYSSYMLMWGMIIGGGVLLGIGLREKAKRSQKTVSSVAHKRVNK